MDIQENPPIADAFKDSEDLSFKQRRRLIAKKRRAAHALPRFLEVLHPSSHDQERNRLFLRYRPVRSWKSKGIHLWKV
jgi:hypothetical protein